MADTAFRILKITAILAVVSTFMVAIHALVELIGSLVFHTVIGEFFAIVSACLPFDASLVFGAIGTATVAILSFLIAKKIFDLTSWSISSI